MELVINAVDDGGAAQLFEAGGLGDQSPQDGHHIPVGLESFIRLPQQPLDPRGDLTAGPQEDLSAVKEALLHGDLQGATWGVVHHAIYVI